LHITTLADGFVNREPAPAGYSPAADTRAHSPDEAALFGDRIDISRAVKHAYDRDVAIGSQVIDRVGRVQQHPQT